MLHATDNWCTKSLTKLTLSPLVSLKVVATAVVMIAAAAAAAAAVVVAVVVVVVAAGKL